MDKNVSTFPVQRPVNIYGKRYQYAQKVQRTEIEIFRSLHLLPLSYLLQYLEDKLHLDRQRPTGLIN